MTLLHEILGQLTDAAFGVDDRRTGAPRRYWPGRLAIAVSIVVSLAIAAVAVVGLHGSSAPPPVSLARPAAPPPAAWVDALGRSGVTTRRRDPACRLPTQIRAGDAHQRFLTTAPPRSITAVLTSLGSPARGPMKVTVSELRALDLDANGIYVRYAWQGETDGIHYYVVPAAVVGTTKIVPRRCYQKQLAVFRAEARHFAANQRAAAMAYAQSRLSPEAVAGVTVATVGGGVSGQSNRQIWMLAELATDPAIGGGGGGNNSSTTTELLVTDQVRSVTATYPRQSYPGRVSRTVSITKHPVRNLVIFHFTGAWDPPQLTFRSNTGAVIARTRH